MPYRDPSDSARAFGADSPVSLSMYQLNQRFHQPPCGIDVTTGQANARTHELMYRTFRGWGMGRG